MLRLGVVEPSISPWASPIFLVKKNRWEISDLCGLEESQPRKTAILYPWLLTAWINWETPNLFQPSTLRSAFWRISVSESSRKFTAFIVPNRGLFHFLRMPFGLSNAPATWQRLIDTVLGSDLEPSLFVYLDDIVVVSESFEKHIFVQEEVYRRQRETNITVSFAKCQFCRPEMRLLGYVIDENGLHVDPDEVRATLRLPVPKSVSEVRRIIGTFSWYRRFIPDFSTIISPMTALLKKSSKFVWTKECEDSFKYI